MRKNVEEIEIITDGQTITLSVRNADAVSEALCGLFNEPIQLGRDGLYAWVNERKSHAQESGAVVGGYHRNYKSLANLKTKENKVYLEIKE